MADAFFTSTQTGVTEDTLIRKIVQDQLLDNSVLAQTVTDLSSEAGPGIKDIDLPKWSAGFDGPEAQNADGDTPVDFQVATFAVDTLALDQWCNLSYAIPDRINLQSKISLEAELAKSAGREMALWVEDKVIAELRLVSTTSPDHLLQLTGASNLVATLDDVANARMLLNKQNIEQNDRYIAISPELEKAFILMENFVKADHYGSNTVLLNAEIGRVFGFRVLVSNRLASAEMLAYHRSHVAMAMQKAIKYEKQRGDVRKQRDEYSFSAGAGFERLRGGIAGVRYDNDGA